MAPPRARTAALVLALGVLARGAVAEPAAATVRLTDVRVERQGDAVTVEITTSGAPKFRSELRGGPFRLVLDFEDATYAWARAPVAAGADPVKELRGSQYRKGIARVVIELARKVPYTLEPHAAGLRVVFGAPKASAAAPATRPSPPKAAVAAPQFQLQGIVLRDEGAVAYIADTATNKVGAYRVGDRLGDSVVETIEERHLVLRTPRGPVEMRLEDPRPAKPVAAPGPPR